MAKPPTGYSAQQGAYFTADGQGPYYWDGTSMLLAGQASGDQLTPVYFSGAQVDTLVWTSACTLMQIVITAGAVGSVEVADEMTATAGLTLITQATTAANDTFILGAGAGLAASAGLSLTVAGAVSGYLVVKGN